MRQINEAKLTVHAIIDSLYQTRALQIEAALLIMAKKRRILTLLDLARSGTIGPVKIGANLNEIGKHLGTPDAWVFAPGERLDSCLKYGRLEVHVEATNDRVNVCYAKLYWPHDNGKLFHIGRPWAKGEFFIRFTSIKERGKQKIKDMFLKEGLVISEDFKAGPITDGIGGVINVGEYLSFYFNNDLNLDTISMARPYAYYLELREQGKAAKKNAD